MTQHFAYQALPSRIVFDTLSPALLAAELDRLGVARALILTTPPQEARGQEIARMLGNRGAGVFAGAVMHTPVAVTEQAVETLRRLGADGVVAFGGGSTTGLAKAIALRTDVPQLIVPTTYAGSEVTPILGETEGGVKTTRTSPAILPETVIYDVDLTLSLPPRLSATSGLNAMAHAAEALYARDGNPVTALMAEEAIAALARALPRIVAAPEDRDARSDALYGAWLSGTCLGTVGMALHHKLCHTLGGSFGLPHAETHAIVLPHAMAYNAAAAPEAMARIARALGAADPAAGLFALGRQLGIDQSLQAIGMPADGLDRAADLAVERPYWNPRPIERDAIRRLLARAWAGDAPEA
ncbi:maleylacetate reductase [Aliidongia dinghuensis]|uniref:Maleylacetate reductase n=1 Tax=Aliidongia dinghuensis TaxID=1867774 RepID=A0A8J2YRY8_9PROT|nr:maleylacetate reductase [Aliidongia dinghuensis]GGF10497.1 maleylacetate reductase [Aliidongia dinghuensis]